MTAEIPPTASDNATYVGSKYERWMAGAVGEVGAAVYLDAAAPPSLSCGGVGCASSRQEAHNGPSADRRVRRRGFRRVLTAGSLVRFSVGGNAHRVVVKAGGVKRVRGVRGQVRCWSPASQRRCLEHLQQVDRRRFCEGHWWSWTLTLPGFEDWISAVEAKAAKRALFKRVQRVFPDTAMLWVEGPQPRRGAPHFHCVVSAPSSVGRSDAFRQLVAESWHEVAGRGQAEHLQFHLGKLGNPHCCDLIRSYDKLTGYLAGYLVKFKDEAKWFAEDRWFEPGRLWGVEGGADWPRRVVEKFLTGGQLAKIRRAVAGVYLHRPPREFFQPGRLEAGRVVRGCCLSAAMKVSVFGAGPTLGDVMAGSMRSLFPAVRPRRSLWMRQDVRTPGGFVLRWDDRGFRVDVKWADFVRILEWAGVDVSDLESPSG